MACWKVACQVILLASVGVASAFDCEAIVLHVHNFGGQRITLITKACEETRIENGTNEEVSLKFFPGAGRIWLAFGNVTWQCGDKSSLAYYVRGSCDASKGMRMRLGFSMNESILVRVPENKTRENATDNESREWRESGAVSMEEQLLFANASSGQVLLRLSVTQWRNKTYDAHLHVVGPGMHDQPGRLGLPWISPIAGGGGDGGWKGAWGGWPGGKGKGKGKDKGKGKKGKGPGHWCIHRCHHRCHWLPPWRRWRCIKRCIWWWCHYR
eukprot:TRINITY_DN8175_c0_g8_i1.p1 TRINITY_DN8175_c0_g8~~TRINITY_DN8175_c0_g8_i1.p1  ORF type:complete len:269 (-),score=37.98 TRINITY_DN8175_c0_g8_i1:243-1049(-)